MATLNFGTVKTPGVYIDEMSLFPPSVAQVDTAIPAFIGPTELSTSVTLNTPTRIGSMAEYRRLFGGAPKRKVTVTLDERNTVTNVVQDSSSAQYMHDSLLMYFGNGGEKCYIVSTGPTTETLTASSYDAGLAALRRYDEPTLLIAPDAVRLGANAKNVHTKLLDHCKVMQDRFAILDVVMTSAGIIDSATEFRTGVGMNALNYGAAYYPYLQTTLPLSVTYPNLTVKQNLVPLSSSALTTLLSSGPDATAAVTAINNVKTDLTAMTTRQLTDDNYAAFSSAATDSAKQTALQNLLKAFYNSAGSPVNYVFQDTALASAYSSYYTSSAYTTLLADVNDVTNYSVTKNPNIIYNRVAAFIANFNEQVNTRMKNADADLRSKSPLYSAIASAAETQAIVLPPSGAIAGVYARTDSERGVWKSPANVSLNYVSAPVMAITDSEQDNLNVAADGSGKSINAIRSFSGKGTLVWGARTLAGSDQEWRYVSVRRFFIMAEESIKKATAQFVFEANDANTWVRLRTMIENFLTLQWRAGALAGAKPDNAFFVRVGLGQTMTPQDVLDGFMIIEIGMAVVRPAEFIVLRFSHKMQQA